MELKTKEVNNNPNTKDIYLKVAKINQVLSYKTAFGPLTSDSMNCAKSSFLKVGESGSVEGGVSSESVSSGGTWW